MMRTNPYPGVFVVLEGMDGNGKTTQVRTIVADFRARGIRIEGMQEPWFGGNVTAEDRRLKAAIEGTLSEAEQPSFEEIQRLFIGNRQRHLRERVVPFLSAAAEPVGIIVCDRYFFSTLAYWIATTGKPPDEIFRAHEAIPEFFLPDLTVIADLSVREALLRISGDASRASRHIFEQEERLERIRTAYLSLPEIFRKRNIAVNLHIVDGYGTPDEVFSRIRPLAEQAILKA